MPNLASIRIYPVKSLDPLDVCSISITAGGSLFRDREYAMRDDQNRTVNGKRYPNVHAIRTTFDMNLGVLTLSTAGSTELLQVRLPEEAGKAGEWLSSYFGFRVHLVRNDASGFPDDTDAPGPTIVSSATLEEVATWYDGMTVADVKRRFRPNLEIREIPPFWEDRLYGASGRPVHFKIGSVSFEGVGPCARCQVPTRDPDTGAVLQGFQKAFVDNRRRTFPPWAPQERFDHYYRLTINTRVSAGQEGQHLNVGDLIEILS